MRHLSDGCAFDAAWDEVLDRDSTPRAESAALHGETVAGETCVWVEAWLGGWWGFDPTNAVPAGERVGAQRLEVTVEVTRLA